MALETQTRQIGEFSYEVTMLGAKLSDRVLLKIARSVAPMFLLAASSGSLKSLDMSSAADAIRDLKEEEFEWVRDQLAASTDVVMADGKKPSLKNIYDLHFAGRVGERLEWFEFAIEVNFGPFFQGLKQKAAATLAARNGAAAMTPPSSSTSPAT